MKRWNARVDGNPKFDSEVEAPRVDRFLTAIEYVSRRHGLSISTSDYGGFIVTEFSQDTLDWLMCSSIDLDQGDLV